MYEKIEEKKKRKKKEERKGKEKKKRAHFSPFKCRLSVVL